MLEHICVTGLSHQSTLMIKISFSRWQQHSLHWSSLCSVPWERSFLLMFGLFKLPVRGPATKETGNWELGVGSWEAKPVRDNQETQVKGAQLNTPSSVKGVRRGKGLQAVPLWCLDRRSSSSPWVSCSCRYKMYHPVLIVLFAQG